MTFSDFIDNPQSKKITIVEIDAPLSETWLNYEPGIWYALLSPGIGTFEDDFGNTGFWGPVNDQYFNIQSFNVDGGLYAEESTLAGCIANERTWFYDISTTFLYVHFNDFLPAESFLTIAPGAAIGFTQGKDETNNNYFENIYYEDLITSVPNFTKKKDSLFFGILQFQGGTITFNNVGGYFDNFSQRDLYGQPVRIKLSFEGLPLEEQLLVYTGRVEDFKSPNFTTFTLQVADVRKLLSRTLPINTLLLTDYPDMADNLDGTPIPIAFGPIINAPAYRVTDTTVDTWVFCDVEFNAVDSGITVVDEDGVLFSHTGTGVDGTFTGTDTGKKLFVTFSVSVVENGLDIISDVLTNYEDISFTSLNYDLTEWNAEKSGVANEGIWIGKGNLLTSVDIIEQICVDNQGVFDVLADGRFTFRTFNPDRQPLFEIFEDELMSEPAIDYDSEEYLSSVKVNYSKDVQEKEFELYTNLDFQNEVFGRYRQYKEREFDTALTNQTDAETLSNDIMEISQFIFPKISLNTKTQNINMRILDNIIYEYKRQNGNVILPQSRFQCLSITLDMSSYEMNFNMKQIEEDSGSYNLLEGGDSLTDYDYYDGGDSTTDFNYVDGGSA